jgi:hypothetical protein
VWAGLARARRSEEEWGPCEDIGFCSGARLGRGETSLRGGKRSDDHEVSILIRLGDRDRVGGTPSNVSMMIMRPRQHGHRLPDEGVSVSLSASV